MALPLRNGCRIVLALRTGPSLHASVDRCQTAFADQLADGVGWPSITSSFELQKRCKSLSKDATDRVRRLIPQEFHSSRKWVLRAELGASASTAESAASTATFDGLEEAKLDDQENLEDVGGATDSAESAVEPALTLAAASKVIPHPEKVAKGGEDAHFFTTAGVPAVVCVADGVGGWANDGVDPALYSRELVQHAQEAHRTADPRALLTRAYEKTTALGAATAIVGVLDGGGRLRVANVGDSGLRVVRGGHVVFATPPHQHYFDCPFQLGPESPDTPEDAQLFEVEVQEGDTLVVGSDGLFDNVFDRDIAAVVSVFGGADALAAEHTAAALAALAHKHALDAEYDSPYSLEAIDQGLDVPFWMKILGKKLTGGKVDDITVVVAHVVREGPTQALSDEEASSSPPV